MNNRSTQHQERVRFIDLHQQGLSYHQISAETGFNYYTVRKWIRKFKRQGWAGIDPNQTQYHAQGALCRFDPLVKYVVLKLKRTHPGWGLDVLRLALSRQPSLKGVQLPSRTALYNYLKPFYHRFRLKRATYTKRPHLAIPPTTAVHQRWQMDFKGEVQIEPAGIVYPFILCDEHSSAPLAGQLFVNANHHPKKGLTTRDVQLALRQVFAQWGLPAQLRMDRATIFVGSARLEWPGVLLLWLIGLGITPVVNRPGRPTDNAQVERLNRTWLEHVGLTRQPASASQLQLATDQAWHDRLYHLPSSSQRCLGNPPALQFPDLFDNPRSYHPDCEAELFEMDKVFHYLSQWQWRRKVDVTGSISLNRVNRLVSKSHCGQIVNVRFCAESHLFVASAMDGTDLGSFSIPSIDSDFICGTGMRL